MTFTETLNKILTGRPHPRRGERIGSLAAVAMVLGAAWLLIWHERDISAADKADIAAEAARQVLSVVGSGPSELEIVPGMSVDLSLTGTHPAIQLVVQHGGDLARFCASEPAHYLLVDADSREVRQNWLLDFDPEAEEEREILTFRQDASLPGGAYMIVLDASAPCSYLMRPRVFMTDVFEIPDGWPRRR